MGLSPSFVIRFDRYAVTLDEAAQLVAVQAERACSGCDLAAIREQGRLDARAPLVVDNLRHPLGRLVGHRLGRGDAGRKTLPARWGEMTPEDARLAVGGALRRLAARRATRERCRATRA